MDGLLRRAVRRQHAGPAEDLTPSGTLRLLATAASLAAVGAGCGGGEPDNAAIGAAGSSPGTAGFVWAVGERPTTVDPLYASNSAEALAARQIHEPLVESLTAPFGAGASHRPGLALSVSPSGTQSVWRVRLRPGVRFQDGTPFNAAAVLANVERWRSVAAGRAALGDLLVDAPRPDLVRFILPAPDRHFRERLASPRLGIVSPRAIAAAGGGPLDATRLPESGTGPFELRERSRDRLLLARNTSWWGTERRLGPGLDQIELRVVPDARERLAQLRDGTARVAELGRHDAQAVRANPLLSVIGPRIGAERSVRGIPSGEPAPSLNGAWVTGIDAG